MFKRGFFVRQEHRIFKGRKLKDLTDEEIDWVLDNAEGQTALDLAAVCAEVLRRMRCEELALTKKRRDFLAYFERGVPLPEEPKGEVE
jgi:hypothetical protein